MKYSINSKFGSWTIIGPADSMKKVLCRCVCGIEKQVAKSNLQSGASTSCGCVSKHTRAMKHGLGKVPEYQIWKAMKARCYGVNHKNYSDYGGRGIKVCERWKDNFQAFYADMGSRPSDKHSIERSDHNGDYSPDNCRWATQKEQTRNTRRSKTITHNGETKTVAEWADITGIDSSTIYHRLYAGWAPAEALSTSGR